MEQRDYLKQQIDALGRALGKVLEMVLGLKSEGKQELAAHQGFQALREELNVDWDELLQLPEESFVEGLKASGELRNQHLETIANILFESMEGLEEEFGKDQKEKLLRRLIFLLEYLNATDSTYSMERHFKIEHLQRLLGNA